MRREEYPGGTLLFSAEKRAALGQSAQVFIDQLCHLKHTDLLFAIKDFFKLVIGVDHALVLAVLQSVFVDIIPELIRNFLARNRLSANYGPQRSIGLQRLL